MPRNVLITGAFGLVGTAIIDHLGDREEYAFTYLDREAHPEYDAHVADIANLADIRPAFDGQDAVVHLAGNPSPATPWGEILRNNIVGTYNVLEAARDAGVESVLFASTNQVVGEYPKDPGIDIADPNHGLSVDHRDPVRPNSYYAVSKLFGEHLGRYYVESDGAPERFYAIRIGWVVTPEYDHPYGAAERDVDLGRFERGSAGYQRRSKIFRAIWCSRRDMAQLVDRALADESIEFDVFYARSAGTRQWLDIEHTRDVLGYEPQDDAEDATAPPE